MDGVTPDETSGTEAGLMANVLADPLSDLPRLVYADWLDAATGSVACPAGCKLAPTGEHCVYEGPHNGLWSWNVCRTCGGTGVVSDGQPERGEFIRVQCELSRLTAAGDVCQETGLPDCCSPARQSLRKRERELWAERAWFDEVGFNCYLTPPQAHAVKRSGVLRRGFVAEVRAPLATLFGGVCGRCHGSGMSEREYQGVTDNDGGCHDCKGTGRTEGIARDLFGRHPVTTVAITDRRPMPGPAGVFSWWSSRDGDNAGWHRLPWAVFERLTGYTDKLGPSEKSEERGSTLTNVIYPDQQRAITGASAACVAYGRELAGLDPLPGGAGE